MPYKLMKQGKRRYVVQVKVRPRAAGAALHAYTLACAEGRADSTGIYSRWTVNNTLARKKTLLRN